MVGQGSHTTYKAFFVSGVPQYYRSGHIGGAFCFFDAYFWVLEYKGLPRIRDSDPPRTKVGQSDIRVIARIPPTSGNPAR